MKTANEVTGLQIGERINNFIAEDIYGQSYQLSEALKISPVVLIFIRGQWCPFCNSHLKKIQDRLPEIYKKGASVVVISPEKSEFIQRTIKKTGTEFTILFDKNYDIASQFDVVFLPTLAERLAYNILLGAKLKESHSDDSEQLYIPATYIINQDYTIRWRHFDINYKKRASVREILEQL